MDNLNESKIEDDAMVEIIFQFTNISEQNKVKISGGPSAINTVSTPSTEASTSAYSASSTITSTTTATTTATSQKRQYTEESQEKTSVTFAKVPTRHEEARPNPQNESDGQQVRSRKKKHRSKSDLGLFKNMFNKPAQASDYRSSGDGAEKPDSAVTEQDRDNHDPKTCFVHYDSRSIMANFNPSMAALAAFNNYSHITSGAAAAQPHDISYTDATSDQLLLDTPNFVNEVYTDPAARAGPNTSLLKHCPKHQIVLFEGISRGGSDVGVSNRDKLLHGISMSDHTVDRRFLCFEHMDHGSNYYRRYFADYDHVNYIGDCEGHGPVAVSMRRDKANVGSEKGDAVYQYRIIIRTAQYPSLRGSILEDFLPSKSNGKIHFKDIMDCLAPEIKQDNLKLAESNKHVIEELIKLDEMPLNTNYKVGLVYCKAGQSTEEDMYNNNDPSEAFIEFMDSIGEKVQLKGFDGYRAGLDTKDDNTGTHSLYTRYNHCQLMFHVSTLLPFTSNDRQQVVRKRHIGNDIVTLVFQEPGSVPFTPAHFRSHYQHVFVVVRVRHPNTKNTAYQIAVTRANEVPEFGPPIPEQWMKKGSAFRHFLLTKLINAENASLKAKKLATMASRTREQLLKSLVDDVNKTSAQSASKRAAPSKVGRSWSLRRKTRFTHKLTPETVSVGALRWDVTLTEQNLDSTATAASASNRRETACILAISLHDIIVVDARSREMLYRLPCRAILGWTSSNSSLKVYYDTGEVIELKRTSRMDDDNSNDIDNIVKRLTCVTQGCETQQITVIKNQSGKLGFHIQFQGIVGDVRENGPAWAAGLRPSSRLLEVGGQLVAHMEHDKLITQLKGRDSVVVVALPPFPDGQARRSLSQLASPQGLRANNPLVPSESNTSSSATATAGATRTTSAADSDASATTDKDVIAPLISRQNSMKSSSRKQERLMTRGSMIALNLLEKDLGIENKNKMAGTADVPPVDIDQLLESIVGSTLKECEDDNKSLEGKSRSSSQHSLNSEQEPPTRHHSYVLSPASTWRKTNTSAKYTGKRYALGSDSINFNGAKERGQPIGAEESKSRDINELLKIIDKTRTETEANNRSPSDDISEIDAVVKMIEKVLESTDDVQTQGLPSNSQTDQVNDEVDSDRHSTPEPARGLTSPTLRNNHLHHSDNTDPNAANALPSKSDYMKKISNYKEDVTRAIEMLDSIKVDAPTRSVSSSSLSDDGFSNVNDTSDSMNIQSSSSEEDFPQRAYTMRKMRREGLLMDPSSDTSDGRFSDDIPPSPLQMLMERAKEAQLENSSDNSWVRTTLLRIAELEAALERSNFELRILKNQNREMEQTLEIVDEENGRLRREMDRTSSQLSTYTQWVQTQQQGSSAS